MATEEIEIAIEIMCTNLPGKEWHGEGSLYLGIQRDEQLMEVSSVRPDVAKWELP